MSRATIGATGTLSIETYLRRTAPIRARQGERIYSILKYFLLAIYCLAASNVRSFSALNCHFRKLSICFALSADAFAQVRKKRCTNTLSTMASSKLILFCADTQRRNEPRQSPHVVASEMSRWPERWQLRPFPAYG